MKKRLGFITFVTLCIILTQVTVAFAATSGSLSVELKNGNGNGFEGFDVRIWLVAEGSPLVAADGFGDANVDWDNVSAELYFDLRRQGITVRNTIDILIAFTAIVNQLPLLHNDQDFDFMAEKIPELKILK